MAATLLIYYWRQLTEEPGMPDDIAGPELEKIQAAYNEDGRYYHNERHIDAMLRSFATHSAAIQDKPAVLLAIFYHDIVYTVPGPENEYRSALRAEGFLRQLSFPDEFIAKVKQFIEATKTHQPTGDSDLGHLLDFDLQILAAPQPVYRQYAYNIRKEYAVYPNDLYNPGRAQVVRHFLDMPHIFKTPAFRELYEKQARENLSAELVMLT